MTSHPFGCELLSLPLLQYQDQALSPGASFNLSSGAFVAASFPATGIGVESGLSVYTLLCSPPVLTPVSVLLFCVPDAPWAGTPFQLLLQSPGCEGWRVG